MDDDDYLYLFSKKSSSNSLVDANDRKYVLILLVLGNGFDLQCGLNSSYKDFFDSCMEDNEKPSLYKQIESNLVFPFNSKRSSLTTLRSIYEENNDISVWDFYFIYEKLRQRRYDWKWIEVEKIIRNSVVEDKFWDKTYSYFSKLLLDGKSVRKYKRKRRYSLEELMACLLYDRYITKQNTFIDRYHDDLMEKFYKFLVSEMQKFEARFGSYLGNEYEKNKDEYIKVSRKNIEELYKTGVKKIGINYENTILRILSFNYIPLIDSKYNSDYVLNIHGDLESPIFGFDTITNSKKYPNMEYYNMLSKEIRGENNDLNNLYNIIPDSSSKTIVVTYGISFDTLDKTDYKDIFTNQGNGHLQQMICFYPKEKSHEAKNAFTTEIAENLRTLVKEIGESRSYKFLKDHGIIKSAPLALDKIKKSS